MSDSTERPLPRAGVSARAEHERRRAKDEAATRAAWGKLGGIAVALTPERSSTRVWATGAIGEEVVGAKLDAIASDQICVLHDRRIPKSRANIDHIVVTPGGVWVIDTKRYVDKRIEKRVEGGLFSPRVEKLWVGGDNTKLVVGMTKQVALVEAAVPGVPVKGVLCFVEGDWAWFADPFTVSDVLVLWPKMLVQLLTKEPSVGVDVAAVHDALATTFRSS
ncbi:nuclease-like protein [Microcella putealis]|uniref:Nuclease-like protein n=1 Tax=Microcella putealis TaxID=337005 RepID=A0A4Q7LVM7_9MICO|nr:nuclease-related domain-containing protein [Microcella putealis]RZS57739.1 nuclease-like protein [Microcella putealis]TQM24806.1 nuclease-like protein [Microcella putealis]